MFKFLFILIVIAGSCTATSEDDHNLSRKYHYKYPHHHILRRGLIHYWIFLAIKAKIIFLIGTFISFWVFAGKAFAFLYYISRSKEKCDCHDSGKIIYEDPHFEHKHLNLHSGPPPPLSSFPPPSDYFQKKIFFNGPNIRPKYSTIRNQGPTYENNPNINEKFSRSFANSIFGNMELFRSIINKADLTEIAFDTMHLKEKSCKMRFVCETDQWAKNNSLLAFSMHLFSDVGLMKYRTNTTSIEDCKALGPHCKN